MPLKVAEAAWSVVVGLAAGAAPYPSLSLDPLHLYVRHRAQALPTQTYSCQYLFFCTSKASQLRTSVTELRPCPAAPQASLCVLLCY